jgi:hypothetical protein
MSRTAKRLAVVPDASNDPLALQSSVVEQAGKTRALAVERLTAARKDHQRAEAAFDDGQLDVTEKVKAAEILGRAERLFERAAEAEKSERATLDSMVAARRRGEYEAAIGRAQDWLVKARPSIDAIVEVVLAVLPKVDAICDVIVESQGDYQEAARLEAEVHPTFTMVARGIRPVDVEGLRFITQVAIGRALRARGLELPGDWLSPVYEPRAGAPRDAYETALSLLEPKEPK